MTTAGNYTYQSIIQSTPYMGIVTVIPDDLLVRLLSRNAGTALDPEEVIADPDSWLRRHPVLLTETFTVTEAWLTSTSPAYSPQRGAVINLVGTTRLAETGLADNPERAFELTMACETIHTYAPLLGLDESVNADTANNQDVHGAVSRAIAAGGVGWTITHRPERVI